MNRLRRCLYAAFLLAITFLPLAIPAAPVRVLILVSAYPSESYPVSVVRAGGPYLMSMLENPAGLTGALNLTNDTLGTNVPPIFPKDGFRIDTVGRFGTNLYTTENVNKFMNLLDSVDVLVMFGNMGFGAIVKADSDRVKFLSFAERKGIVALHKAIDNHSSSTSAPTWAAYDSLCGVRYKDANTSLPRMVRDTLPYNTSDPDFAQLSSGLLPAYRFTDRVMSFTANPRSLPGMHTLYTLDESTFIPSTAMGDHPFVWYRRSLSGKGGRYFYTAEGLTDTLYIKNYSFRRQFYNAVVWASGYDSATGEIPTPVRPGEVRAVKSGVFRTTVSGSTLTVTPIEAANYKVEVRVLDGRRITSAEAEDGKPINLSLRPHALYTVTVESLRERRSALVAIP